MRRSSKVHPVIDRAPRDGQLSRRRSNPVVGGEGVRRCSRVAGRVMSRNDELSHALLSVHDEETFLQFLLALRDDREASVAQEEAKLSSPYGPDAGGWENTTIERFLDTAVRWARDSVNGNPFYQRPDNPWRRCADILFAAKGYE